MATLYVILKRMGSQCRSWSNGAAWHLQGARRTTRAKTHTHKHSENKYLPLERNPQYVLSQFRERHAKQTLGNSSSEIPSSLFRRRTTAKFFPRFQTPTGAGRSNR